MTSLPINMDNLWLPFTPNRTFKNDPRVFAAADGMYSPPMMAAEC